MRLSNIPIPELHVAAVIAAFVIHRVLPIRIPIGRAAGRIIGVSMLAAGIGFAASAVASAGDAELEGGDELVTTGVYALSRNPMYVGWSASVLGLALWTRSASLLGAWTVAVLALDLEINREEAQLLDRFGSDYETYRAQVPRYIAISIRGD
jgi:protein-S-isoprenylcysteine O-methyltransferase Ste14